MPDSPLINTEADVGAAEMLGISLKTLHNKLNRMKAEQGQGQGE